MIRKAGSDPLIVTSSIVSTPGACSRTSALSLCEDRVSLILGRCCPGTTTVHCSRPGTENGLAGDAQLHIRVRNVVLRLLRDRKLGAVTKTDGALATGVNSSSLGGCVSSSRFEKVS